MIRRPVPITGLATLVSMKSIRLSVLGLLVTGVLLGTACDDGTAPESRLSIRPSLIEVEAGEHLQLSTIITGADNSGGGAITWTVADTSVASVDDNGLLVGKRVGTTVLTAISGSLSTQKLIEVIPPVITAVRVSPDSLTLIQGQSVVITIAAMNAGGLIIGGRDVTYSSSDPNIARLYPDQVLRTGLVGRAVIHVTVEGRTDSLIVHVVARVVARLESPASTTVAMGQQTRLTTYLFADDGNFLENNAVEWSAADSTIARVAPAGPGGLSREALITGRAVGTTTITGSASGQTVHVQVKVGPAATSPWKQVVQGLDMLCALNQDGQVFCSGGDANGQLGRGGLTAGGAVSPQTLQRINGAWRFSRISAYQYNVCGLVTDGRVVCWGSNPGNPSYFTRGAPGPIDWSATFSDVTAGLNGSCALATDKTVSCWASAIGGMPSFGGPTQLDMQGTQAHAISLGAGILCITDAQGAAYCIGSNGSTNGGHPGTKVLTRVVGTTGLDDIAVNPKSAFACGRIATHYNCFDAFSRDTMYVAQPFIPFKAPPTLWNTYGCGISVDGSAFCFDGVSSTAYPVGQPDTFVSLSAGSERLCGVTTPGDLYCWTLGTTSRTLFPRQTTF